MMALRMFPRQYAISPEVLAKVKAEKVDRKEFQATLKKKKYDSTKEHLEKVAFGNDDDGAAM